jgi:hypothetical protein
MRRFIIPLVCAVMLCGADLSAQSNELLEAIKTAEEQQKQKRFVEAIETLTAIKSTASEEMPDDFLEKPYNTKDEKLAANEFYLKDTALQKLVNVLLETKNSATAATTALHIENKNLRNTILLDIMQRQCCAAYAEQFDLMMGKAEATAQHLTGEHRDRGYEHITAIYANKGRSNRAAGKLDRAIEAALEAVQKIAPGEHRDRGYNSIVLYYTYASVGEFDSALEIMEKIVSGEQRDIGHATIAAGYARASKHALAMEIMEKIVSEEQRDNGYVTIAAIYASDRKHDLAMETVKKVVADQRRDSGYAAIARSYVRIQEYDLALATVPKIDATRRDYYIVDGSISYEKSPFIYTQPYPRPQTPEYAEYRRGLIDLIQKPTSKAAALFSEAQRYKEGKNEEKRLEVLIEAAVLIPSLPNVQELSIYPTHSSRVKIVEKTIGIMFRISNEFADAGQKVVAETIRTAAMKEVLSIENENVLFDFVASNYYYSNWFQPAEIVPLLERMKPIAEKTGDPDDRAERWITIIKIVRNRTPPRSEEYKAEAWDKVRLAALQIDVGPHEAPESNRQMTLLSYLFWYADTAEQIDTLLKDYMKIALTPGNEVRGLELIKAPIERGSLKYDRLMDVIHSPHIPDEWKQRELYYWAAYRVLEPYSQSTLQASLPKGFDHFDAAKKLLVLVEDSDRKDWLRAYMERLERRP